MSVYETLNGYEQLKNFLKTCEPSKKLVLLFTGSSTDTTTSWCPDCVSAEPIIGKVLEENQEKNFVFAKVAVGSRSEWKDPKCPFRTDSRLKLTSVPTLLLWGTVKRLNDSECQNEENIRLILEEV